MKRKRPIPESPFHSKSDAELHFIIKDASAAARNMRGFDERAESKYLDQVNDAVTILNFRNQLAADEFFKFRRAARS